MSSAHGPVLLPAYDRDAPRDAVITHLGFGAFARAHVAVYADDLLRQGRPASIRGVALRSRRAQDELEPQDGLFTVAVQEPGEEQALQVIGSLASMQTGEAAALDALSAPGTTLVTVTITEKGYAPPGGEGAALSVPAVIASALQRRRQSGLSPPVVASLDNLLENGATLRTRVLQEADRIDGALAQWVGRTAHFPNSVVDRMVPAPTASARAAIADVLGLRDEAAVATERHRSWVMQAVPGLDFLADAGVELVDDLAPYERRKLWLLNGPHSAVAYGGLLAGHATIAAAVSEPVVARFVRALIEETLEVASFPVALRPGAFAADALRRFANPTLGHACAQVGADGSSKLPQRLLPIVGVRASRSLDTTRFALVAAIWLAAAGGVSVPGTRLPELEDPIAPDLRAATSRGGLQALSRVALGATPFAAEVAHMLERLTSEGPRVLEWAP